MRHACRVMTFARLTQPLAWSQVIHLITAEGVVKIPGRRLRVPRVHAAGSPGVVTPGALADAWGPPSRPQALPSWEEQGLCIGSTFALAATNGRDPARRVQFLGFCQSVDHLRGELEWAISRRGGEVLEEERQLKRCMRWRNGY
jgi:hypothetical protein